jgi:hypothetical protein
MIVSPGLRSDNVAASGPATAACQTRSSTLS